MKKVLLLFFALVFFMPVRASAQTPTLGYFTASPWPHPFRFPCTRTTDNIHRGDPEFHPLRPYPGNPCDPLIPRKIPEAPVSTNPEKSFLTFDCAKSINLSGTYTVKDVIDICNLLILPPYVYTHPEDLLYDAHGNSPNYLCEPASTDVCQVKRVTWGVSIDLSKANLPVMGNTETVMSDAAKVNTGLDWYLNGTIYQSEQLPLEGITKPGNLDTSRIVNFSGPINKLIPKDLRNYMKVGDTYTNVPGMTSAAAGRGTQYHNYLVACQRNVDIPQIIQWAVNYITLLKDNLTIILGNAADAGKLIADFGLDFLATFSNHTHDISNYLNQISIVFHDLGSGNGMAESDFIGLAHTYLQNISFNHVADDGHLLFIILSNDIQFFENISYFLHSLSLDVAESCTTSTQRWRLTRVDGDPQPWIMRYVPYATLEDVTSEITVSVIPQAQPVAPEIDGTIISIGLSINTGSDSRLYFAHMKSAVALSELLNSFHTPVNRILCGHDPLSGLPLYCNSVGTGPTPTPPFHFNPTWTSQAISLHQGLNDSTIIQGEDRQNPRPGAPVLTNRTPAGAQQIALLYSQGRLIRNTEVIEGAAAPPPLYTPVPQNWRCEPGPSINNPGDSLLGQQVNGTLTYYQLVRYAPREVIDCAGGCAGAGRTGQSICVTKPCEYENTVCNITDYICCTDELAQPPPGGYDTAEGNCPFVSDCVSADKDFQCIPRDQEFECQNNPTQNHYWQHYNQFTCTRRDGSQSDFYCCGPQEDPVYNDWCGPDEFICNYYHLDCSYCASLDPASCKINLWCDSHHDLIYPGHAIDPNPPLCPLWPNRDLKTAARINPFTKTPLVEKLYDLLVVNPQSLLHRWLPQIPLSPTDTNFIKVGRDNTIPAETGVLYNASVVYPTPGTIPDITNVRVTAGNNSRPSMFFPHLGSLSEYILEATREKYNIQCLLRPQGKCYSNANYSKSFCTGDAYQNIAGLTDAPAPISQAQDYFNAYIANRLTPDLIDAYAQAESQTGVPCEVMAGIHFVEGDLDPNRNLQNGGPLNSTLAESAIAAAKELRTHACPSFTGNQCDIPDLKTLIQALSWYNGGGNRNCQTSTNCAAAHGWPDRCGRTVACASSPDGCYCVTPNEPGSCRATCGDTYPYTLSPNPGLCPAPYVGFDDPYATNWWQSVQQNMYVLMSYDCTFTPAIVPWTNPGALPVAIMVHNSGLNP